MKKEFCEIHLDPVDKQAAIVTSKAPRWAKFEDINNTGANQIGFQERIRSILAGGGAKPPKETTNYVGVTHGRVTVIAYSHSRKPNPRKERIHYWVVRCTCGEYEIRTHVALRRQGKERDKDMCSQCHRTAYLQRTATGERPKQQLT